MERIKRCKNCKKRLDEFEGCQIPIYIPARPYFPLPSGGVELYCERCYRDAIGETFLEEEKNLSKKEKELFNKLGEFKEKELGITSINEARLGTNVTVIGVVDSDVEYKNVTKEDKTFKLSICEIRDDTGKMILILWENMANKVENRKVYKVQGYIQEFNGQKQITLGYKGKIKEMII